MAGLPSADWLVGVWQCRSRRDGSSFEWHVTRDLAGPWLTGVGIEGGRKLSLDVWAFDAQGRLGLRRQFTARGGIIEMQPSALSDAFLLEGEMQERDGVVVKLRERVTVTGERSFAATWEIFRNAAWAVVVDEACERRG